MRVRFYVVRRVRQFEQPVRNGSGSLQARRQACTLYLQSSIDGQVRCTEINKATRAKSANVEIVGGRDSMVPITIADRT
jgi:hypothetical protein